MRNTQVKKIIAIIIMAGIMFFGFQRKVDAAVEIRDTEYASPEKNFQICASTILSEYTTWQKSDEEEGVPEKKEEILKTKTEITSEMIDNKVAIPITGGDGSLAMGKITANTSSAILTIARFGSEVEHCQSIRQEVANALGVNVSKVSVEVINCGVVDDYDEDEDSINGCTKWRVNCKISNGDMYSWCIGKSGEYMWNFYMVKVKEAVDVAAFKTDLDYEAYVGNVEVGGGYSSVGNLSEVTGAWYVPSYDKNNPKKDADVTAVIVSRNGQNIASIKYGEQDVAINADGTPNSLGWKYSNKDVKTVIEKVYKFDEYNNTTSNGIAIENGLVVTSEDGLTDTQNVSIKWPFRIIDVQNDPEKIDEKTEKVTVTITTNLPIDKEKLPSGYSFTDDELGKSQHKIFKTYYKKDGNVKETVTVIANGRDDKDARDVEINWVKKSASNKVVLPKTGSNSFALFVTGLVAVVSVGVITRFKIKK